VFEHGLVLLFNVIELEESRAMQWTSEDLQKASGRRFRFVAIGSDIVVSGRAAYALTGVL
jgi:hypothetical protein